VNGETNSDNVLEELNIMKVFDITPNQELKFVNVILKSIKVT
jgi:hypothetical protein